MNFTLQVHDPEWKSIFTIQQDTMMERGGESEATLYKALIEAANSVKDQFGCYAWVSSNKVLYCGSFTANYVNRKSSNLASRMHNYMRNHGTVEKPNTNKRVFTHISETAQRAPVSLCLFTFRSVQIGDDMIAYSDYTKKPDLVLAVERLLIYLYRHEEGWNRA